MTPEELAALQQRIDADNAEVIEAMAAEELDYRRRGGRATPPEERGKGYSPAIVWDGSPAVAPYLTSELIREEQRRSQQGGQS